MLHKGTPFDEALEEVMDDLNPVQIMAARDIHANAANLHDIEEKRMTDNKKRAWAAFSIGTLFVLLAVWIAISVPTPTSLQYTLFRSLFALGAGGYALFLTGLLEIKTPLIKAGGPLAVMVLMYIFNPAAPLLMESGTQETIQAPASGLSSPAATPR